MFWIRIRPLIYLRDLNLNDGFDKVLKEPDQKDSVKSATVDMIPVYKIFFTLKFWDVFSRIRIWIFPDRIRIFGRSGSGLRQKSLIRIQIADSDPAVFLNADPDPAA